MKDRFLFRGKRVDTGKWLIGFYAGGIDDIIDHEIICKKTGDVYEVNPATLGQCTGFRDKHGKLIFEGDIVSHHRLNDHAPEVFKVKWHDKYVRFIASMLDDSGFIASAFNFSESEIIGNVHEHPELLKGGADV